MTLSSNLNEGLRQHDLKNLIHPVFEVDTFKSKMGNDADVCVVTFQAKDRYPARDLSEFIERGYDFVLDADVSAGENKQGEYSVFVEVERNENIAENLQDLLYGVKNLTGIEKFDFRYYKDNTVQNATRETLESIPTTEKQYLSMIKEYQVDATRKFFDRTVMDNLEINNESLTIVKPFGNRIQLEIVDEGSTDDVLNRIDDPLTETAESTAEAFWLTKVLGDYDITKYGENFLFTNNDRAILLKRR